MKIDAFRYDNKEEALDMCAKHEDCGGISQNRDGSFECRAKEFIKENGAISFKKPRNFKSPVYTEDDVDPSESNCISSHLWSIYGPK